MLNTTIEIITPAIAGEYLSHNKMNRPLRSKHIEELMRDMIAGKWRLTHQGIAFDAAGNLIDGQHRLTAVALSGVSIQSMVTRDLPSETGRVIDVQAVRSYNDSLIFEPKDVPTIWRSTKVQAAVRSLVAYGYQQNYVMTNSQFDAMLERFKLEVGALGRISVTRSKNVGGQINAAFLAALINGETEDSLRSFYSVLALCNTKESDGYNIQAPFKLAQYLIKEKERGGGVDRKKLYNVAQNAIWHYIHEEETRILLATKTLRYPVSERIHSVLVGKNHA